MADDKKKRGGADRALIALSEPYEVAYWSKKFKITPAKLKSAVEKVGRSAKKVEAYFALLKHKAADRALIAVSQPYEVRYWSKKFKVTPAKLKAAVPPSAIHRRRSANISPARRRPRRRPKKPSRKRARKRQEERKEKGRLRGGLARKASHRLQRHRLRYIVDQGDDPSDGGCAAP